MLGNETELILSPDTFSAQVKKVTALPTKLAADLLHYVETVERLRSPESVLDELDEITWPAPCRAHVAGTVLLPLNFGNTASLVTGKTVFLHKSLPKGWWEARMELAARTPAPGDVLGRLALAPFTSAETMKLLEPIGIDRQTAELNLKYGVRDIFTCPIGGRWIFSYWAPKPMPLQQDQRALLYLGALFATTHLQKLCPLSSERASKGHALTPRELSVLRSLSLGYRAAQISKDLGIGEETIRSHIKKAQAKLGVNNTVEAVSQAIRLRLIP